MKTPSRLVERIFQLLLLLLLCFVLATIQLFWSARGLELFSEDCCKRLGMHDAEFRNVNGRKSDFKLIGSSLPVWKLPEAMAAGFSGNQVMDSSKFRLHIKVLTYDRIDSLERCLRSLQDADYGGDDIDLDIYVDHGFDPKGGTWSSKYTRKVGVSHELLVSLDSFIWSHGLKRVHYRSANVGIQPQWLEAWWPESMNDFALVVEDDMELSPLFYKYFKLMVFHYYYNRTNYDSQVYGISFQRQGFVAGEGGRPFHLHSEPFQYQLVGTWGQFLFPAPWRQFRFWYDMRRYNESRNPGLEGLKTTVWWKRRKNKIWTPWIIKWAHAENRYNIYPSFPGNLSLSLSHREVGSNFKVNRMADAELVTEEDYKKLPAIMTTALPPTKDIRRYDLCNRPVYRQAPATSLEELRALLFQVHSDKNVGLIAVPPGGYTFVRNWICHIELHKIAKNYIFLVVNQSEARDLALRGHAVYHAGEGGASQLETSRDVASEIIWEDSWTFGQLQAVQAALVLGFNVLLSSPDKVWQGDPFRLLRNASSDIQGALRPGSLSDSLWLLRSGLVGNAVWEKVVRAKKMKMNVNAIVGLLMNQAVGFAEVEVFVLPPARAKASRSNGSTLVNSTLSSAASLLPNTSALVARKLQTLTTLPYNILALESKTLPASTSLPSNVSTLGANALPIAVPSGAYVSEKKAELMRARLWLIDDFDFACKAVTCR